MIHAEGTPDVSAVTASYAIDNPSCQLKITSCKHSICTDTGQVTSGITIPSANRTEPWIQGVTVTI